MSDPTSELMALAVELDQLTFEHEQLKRVAAERDALEAAINSIYKAAEKTGNISPAIIAVVVTAELGEMAEAFCKSVPIADIRQCKEGVTKWLNS